MSETNIIALLAWFSHGLAFGVIQFFLNKKSTLSHQIALTSSFVSLVCWGFVAYSTQWHWIVKVSLPINPLIASFSLNLDTTTQVMCLLVVFITILVQVFSIAYMHHEVNYNRYFAYLSLFAFAMIGLLLTNHLAIIYIFWELVGVCSFLLISFWHITEEASRASKKAFLFNRIGDIGFLIGILILYAHTQSFLLESLPLLPSEWKFWVGLAILCGALGKSAQFPLHVWLPDAMAGPTPVSALIHAATMVAAGVYLLYRSFAVFGPEVLIIIAFIGGITAFLGSFSALFQYNIKKVLAYSTISQLGYMVAGIGLQNPQIGMQHLWSHAFFKAGLFLAAGTVIHYLHEWSRQYEHFDYQDMRNMGGLNKIFPYLSIAFLVQAMALVGIPFTIGYASKEGILETSLQSNLLKINSFAYLVPLFLFLSIPLTAFYATRQWLWIFAGDSRFSQKIQNDFTKNQENKIIEPKYFRLLLIPVVLLALCSVDWQFWEIRFSWVSLVAILLTSVGTGAAWFNYQQKKFHFEEHTFVKLSQKAFFIDNFYTWLWQKIIQNKVIFLTFFDKKLDNFGVNFMRVGLVLGHLIAWFDRFFVDGLVKILYHFAAILGKQTQKVQQGIIQNYVAWSVLFILLLLYFWLF
ncbi:MAG: NADH-quinone oxidoreductase subunit L [Microscillaceae bacterium]|nr:NADH-quinone oxidoreductase subunit L [Microscillaceae bacterium]MDW8460693.1 NADH-quinone oxidoreductase subunit L [Cytophagales bacterium]